MTKKETSYNLDTRKIRAEFAEVRKHSPEVQSPQLIWIFPYYMERQVGLEGSLTFDLHDTLSNERVHFTLSLITEGATDQV